MSLIGRGHQCSYDQKKQLFQNGVTDQLWWITSLTKREKKDGGPVHRLSRQWHYRPYRLFRWTQTDVKNLHNIYRYTKVVFGWYRYSLIYQQHFCELTRVKSPQLGRVSVIAHVKSPQLGSVSVHKYTKVVCGWYRHSLIISSTFANSHLKRLPP